MTRHTRATGAATLALAGGAVLLQATTANAAPVADLQAAQQRLGDMLAMPQPPSLNVAMKILPHSVTSHSDLAGQITGAFTAPSFGSVSHPTPATQETITTALQQTLSTATPEQVSSVVTGVAESAFHVTGDTTLQTDLASMLNNILSAVGVNLVSMTRKDSDAGSAQKADSEKVGGQGTQVKVDVDVDTNTGDELLGLPLDIATPVAEVVAPVVAWVTRTDQDTATKIGVHLLTRQIPYTVAAALAAVGAALPWNGVIPGAVLGGLAGALPLGLLGAGLGAINPLNLLGVLPGALLGAPVGAWLGSHIMGAFGGLIGFPVGYLTSMGIHMMVRSVLGGLLGALFTDIFGALSGAIPGAVLGLLFGQIVGALTYIPVQILLPPVLTGTYIFLTTVAGFVTGTLLTAAALLIPALIGTVIAVVIALGVGLVVGGIPFLAGIGVAVGVLIAAVFLMMTGFGAPLAIPFFITAFMAAAIAIFTGISFFVVAALPVGGTLVTLVWLVWGGLTALNGFIGGGIGFLFGLLTSPIIFLLMNLLVPLFHFIVLPLFTMNMGRFIGKVLGIGLVQPLKWITVPTSVVLGTLSGILTPWNVIFGLLTSLLGRILGRILGIPLGALSGLSIGAALGYGIPALIRSLIGGTLGALLGGVPGLLLGGLTMAALSVIPSLGLGYGIWVLLTDLLRRRWDKDRGDSRSEAERTTVEWWGRTNIGKFGNSVEAQVRGLIDTFLNPVRALVNDLVGDLDPEGVKKGAFVGGPLGSLIGALTGGTLGALLGAMNPTKFLSGIGGTLLGLVFGGLLGHILGNLGGNALGFLSGWIPASILHAIFDGFLGSVVGFFFGALAPVVLGFITGALAKGLFSTIPAALAGIATWVLGYLPISFTITKLLHILGDIVFFGGAFLLPIIAGMALGVGIMSAVWFWGYFIPVGAILLVTAFVAGLIVAGLCIAVLFFPPAAPFILLGAGILTGIVLLTAGAAIGIGFLLFWLVAVPVGLIGGFFPGLAVALFITALAFIPYLGWRFLSWPLGLSLGAVATSLLAKLVTLALAIPLFLLNLIPGGILGSLVGASLWPLTVPLSILAGRILGSLVGFFNPVNMLAGVIPAIIGGLIGQIVGRNAGSTLGAVLGGLTGYGLTELVNALLGALIGSYAGINVGGTLGVLLGGLLGGKLGLIDQKQDKPKHAKPENGAKAEGSVTIKAGPQGEYAPAPKHRADDDLALEDIINDKTVAPQQSCEMSQDEINKSLQNVPDNKKGAQSEEDLDAMQIHGVSQPQLVIIG